MRLAAGHCRHGTKSTHPHVLSQRHPTLYPTTLLQITQQCTGLINTTATSGTAQRRSLMATNIKITSRVQSNDPAVRACCFGVCSPALCSWPLPQNL